MFSVTVGVCVFCAGVGVCFLCRCVCVFAVCTNEWLNVKGNVWGGLVFINQFNLKDNHQTI